MKQSHIPSSGSLTEDIMSARPSDVDWASAHDLHTETTPTGAKKKRTWLSLDDLRRDSDNSWLDKSQIDDKTTKRFNAFDTGVDGNVTDKRPHARRFHISVVMYGLAALAVAALPMLMFLVHSGWYPDFSPATWAIIAVLFGVVSVSIWLLIGDSKASAIHRGMQVVGSLFVSAFLFLTVFFIAALIQW